MPDGASEQMAKRRALLTDTEQAILDGEKEVKDNYRYSVESRVRTRIRDELPGDVETLREHYPEIFKELCEVVCQTYRCFVCGDHFENRGGVMSHAIGGEHDLSAQEFIDRAPEWWEVGDDRPGEEGAGGD